MIVFVEPGCGNSGSGRMWVLLGASPGAIFPAALLPTRPGDGETHPAAKRGDPPGRVCWLMMEICE
jgi:hypothetical protein